MAAIVFPASPSVNQIFTNNGYSWIWDGATWNSLRASPQLAFAQGTLSAGNASSNVGSVIVDEIAPIGMPSPYGSTNSLPVSNGNAWVLSNDLNLSSAQIDSAQITSAQITSLGVGTSPSGVTGEIRATDNVTAYYSDERLKTKLGKIENAIEKVMSLDGFYYEANETAQALGYKPKKEVGVSAQQVEAIMPEVVAPAPIDDQYLTVRYEKLIPLLIEAIKELKTEIDVLKGK